MRKKSLLSHDEIGSLCLELSLLFHAGVGAADALSLLAQEEPEGELRQLLTEMAGQVDHGLSLSAAFIDSCRFPDYVCSLLEVGEQAGRTEETLSSLSQYYENRARMDRSLRAALLYPCVLLLIMLAVIVVLLTKVLPVFNDVYADLGGQLTGVAGGLLAFGQALDRGMPILCVLLAGTVALLLAFSLSTAFRQRLLAFWRRHWGDRGVSRKLDTARFAQGLSVGLSSGLPLEEATSLSAGILDSNPAAHARCWDCLSRLEGGASLSQAIAQSGVLPSAQCRLLELGLRSGSGDAAMEQIARRLSEESEAALEQKVGQVEPTLVVVASVLVGLILLSVMLPLMHIMTTIG